MKERDHGYDFIRFFATIMICLWHYYTTCKEQGINLYANIDKLFSHGAINMGGVGVGLFFILSGALMIRGNREELNVLSFYKKRSLRICVPNSLGFMGALMATYVINADIVKRDKIGMLLSALGLNFFNPWSDFFGISCVWLIGEWFTTVIIFLYLIFPILRRLFLYRKWIGTLIIALIFVLNLKFKILSNQGGWGSYSNGIMFFWLGMFFEEYKGKISNGYIIIISFLCASCLLLFPIQFHNEFDYIWVVLFSITLFLILYQIKITGKLISIICDLNFEIYLVHHRIYLLLMPALLTSSVGMDQIIICFVLLLWVTILIARALKGGSNRIIKVLLQGA